METFIFRLKPSMPGNSEPVISIRPLPGGGAHDLGFHLFGVENVDVAQQIGQRGHQAVTAPVGAGRGDDAVRRALRQNAALGSRSCIRRAL